jgi:hypothetical protein
MTNTTSSSVTTAGTVVVEIGPDHVKHVLHKALLIYHPEYLQKALQGQWKEARGGVVVLEDIQPAVSSSFSASKRVRVENLV